jgi:hypothetical protein
LWMDVIENECVPCQSWTIDAASPLVRPCLRMSVKRGGRGISVTMESIHEPVTWISSLCVW